MVSSLSSIRVMSAQLLVRSLKETSEPSEDGNARTALLQRYGVDSSSSASLSSSSMATLVDVLAAQQTATTTESSTSTTTETSADITSTSFMAALKQQLQDLVDAPGGDKQAEAMLAAMLAALKDGTLTVSDPVNGVTIKAWDVDDAAEKGTVSKAGEKIDATGWSEFLKSRLTRTENVTYARTADGSYVDKTTEESAYFGTIGSTYSYLSWPQASKTTA